MKEKPRTWVLHFRNSNFKHKIQRLQIPQKLVYKKFYVHEKKLRTSKRNNCDLNRGWIKQNNINFVICYYSKVTIKGIYYRETCNFIKEKTSTQVLPCEYCEIFKNTSPQNTEISSKFLMWKFCGKAQFPQDFRVLVQSSAETVPFHKIFTSEN